MAEKGISGGALKMAWKMVRTVFPHSAIPAKEQDLLLTLAAMIALHDLEGVSLLWARKPPHRATLSFSRKSVLVRPAEKGAPGVKPGMSDREIEKAVDLAEEIFDRRDLDEEERATLFTALPCLGLHALREFLVWKRPPPFPILGKK